MDETSHGPARLRREEALSPARSGFTLVARIVAGNWAAAADVVRFNQWFSAVRVNLSAT